MTEGKTLVGETKDISVEEKLRALYEVQKNDSEIDKILILRGELPLEVQDLEDEVAGLETRISNFDEEIALLTTDIASRKAKIVESEGLIKKYEEQLNNVRNNREFESLTKEVEFQKLEIAHAEKFIRENLVKIADRKLHRDDVQKNLEERRKDLDQKKAELDEIVSDTQKEEEVLRSRSHALESIIEPRLLFAYKRIRSNARNGLGVVSIERESCGGCHNSIPPQRQLDIRSRKKIIVCEYCGRILVDHDIVGQ